MVRYGNRFFQLERQRQHYAPAQGKVQVYESGEGKLAMEYRGQALRWREIAAPARPCQLERPAPPSVAKPRWVPPPDHPWREAVRRASERRAARELKVAARPSLAGTSAPP